MLCWLVEFAACLLNRCDTGSDGKTPTHGQHGGRDNTPILESGEKILYICLPHQQEEESGTHDSILEYSIEC